ncbi:DUF2934 domain-containing protein [Defluviicoccus vanus]|nr:DUF2934 domain-containing protein [Defluviicoccus vanus]
MTNSLHQLAHDIQMRIRDLAYIMWESAGRQQGMALEYWLAAEKEVLDTFQAAAGKVVPAASTSTSAESDAAAIPPSTSADVEPEAPVATSSAAVETADPGTSEPAAPAKSTARAAGAKATKTTRRSTSRSKATP